MKTWFTSDQHFGHKNVIDYCTRPFKSVDDMAVELIQKYNELVAPEDLVYMLGDVSFLKPAVGVPLLQILNGRKILIQGNHDHYSAKQYRDAGFEAVLLQAKIRIGGYSVKLSHFPYWPGDDMTQDRRYEERRPENRGDWLLCGHVHTAWKAMGKQINVGVDVWEYQPVGQDMIEKIIWNQESRDA